jgi:hypothetical protein
VFSLIGRLGVAAILIALLVGPPLQAHVHAASPPGTTCPVLPANNIWNTDISTLPLNSHSAAWLSSTGATGGTLLHPDFGGPPYGIPFNVVTSAHPTANFTFQYWQESDPTVTTQQPQGPYPYGTDLQVEAPTDSHLLSIVSDTCKLYETWATNYNGPQTAGSGAIFDLNSNALRTDGWTSADAAGLPIFPGLVRLDEVQAGAISHAVRFTVQQSDTSHLWPARHDAGAASNANLPPMGARFRLKAGFDISSFNAQAQVVLTAFKHYGMIVADNGSNWFFTGTMDSGWNNAPYTTMVSQLKTVPASAFEAVDESSLMIDPNSGQAAQPGPACTAASLVPASSAPQAAGAAIAFTATATVCPGPRFRYWLLPPGGGWAMQRDYGAAAWSWNTAGLGAGTYEVGVWARQAGSANAYDAYGITTFALGVDNCISAGANPSLAPPQSSGATITFNATSTGCSAPQYQFWLLAPGGGWVVKQAYGGGASWAWNTTGLAAGNYQVGVWAKQTGSSASYDSFFVTSYWISPAAGCVTAGLSASAASPQAVGATLTFTPQQTGCTNQYKFWLLAPGGSWQVVQAYGVGSTWSWNTAGYAAGTYEVGVWEGSSSAPSSYQSYAITSFGLGVATCSSASLSAPAPPQTVGTAIAMSAASTRCGGAQYEFWVQPPGGSWSVKQAYGGTAWTWNTAGLAPGTYLVGVWARQSGSMNSYDSYFIRTYQLS